jgi:hypothetical protein
VWSEFRRVITFDVAKLADHFVVPSDRNIYIAEIFVMRNGTDLEILDRISLVVDRATSAALPFVRVPLRAVYEKPHLHIPAVLQSDEGVTVRLEMAEDTLALVRWPLGVQLIGGQRLEP